MRPRTPRTIMAMAIPVMTTRTIITTITRIIMAIPGITMTTVVTMTTIVTIMATITMTSIATTSITTATPMLMSTNSAEPPQARAMSESEAAALYRLMTWLSPSFPVGAFSYSSGIEWAVEAGDIADAATLRDWLAAMLTDGAGFCDAVFLAQPHRAVASHDDAALRDIAELAAAFVPSRERRLETTTQGRAFIDTSRAAWSCEGLDEVIAACGGAIVYPIAVGLVS